MAYITKASTSGLWFIIEEDEYGNEKYVGSTKFLKNAKQRARERKDIVGDDKIVTIERIDYVAKLKKVV